MCQQLPPVMNANTLRVFNVKVQIHKISLCHVRHSQGEQVERKRGRRHVTVGEEKPLWKTLSSQIQISKWGQSSGSGDAGESGLGTPFRSNSTDPRWGLEE